MPDRLFPLVKQTLPLISQSHDFLFSNPRKGRTESTDLMRKGEGAQEEGEQLGSQQIPFSGSGPGGDNS